nr:hypothetical protein [Pseudomaricurvus alkylphenolicus]
MDIKSFFDEMDKSKLRELRQRRIGDGVILRLINKWLKAGVLEGNQIHYPETGASQGGVISPILQMCIYIMFWTSGLKSRRLHGCSIRPHSFGSPTTV